MHNILKQFVINTNTLQIKTICLCYFVRTWIRITVSENVGEIGTCYSSVKQWNKSAKEVMGTILFLLKKLISFWKKEQQNIPTRKRDDLVISVVNNRGVRF